MTGRVQWHQPTMPQMVELDDSGDALFVDAEEDRVMPSRSTLLSGAACRSVLAHGGCFAPPVPAPAFNFRVFCGRHCLIDR